MVSADIVLHTEEKKRNNMGEMIAQHTLDTIRPSSTAD